MLVPKSKRRKKFMKSGSKENKRPQTAKVRRKKEQSGWNSTTTKSGLFDSSLKKSDIFKVRKKSSKRVKKSPAKPKTQSNTKASKEEEL